MRRITHILRLSYHKKTLPFTVSQEMGKIAHTHKVTDQYTDDIESFPGYVSARIVQL